MITSHLLYPPEVSSWDEAEKERQIAAGQLLLEQIRQAHWDHQNEVTIPAGNYRFPGEAGALLEDLQDISLKAENVTFWFSPNVAKGLHFRNCRNVTLSGITFDLDGLPFLQGTLLELQENQLVIRLDEYFVRRFHEETNQDHFRLMFLDSEGRYETDSHDLIVSRESLRIDADGNVTIPISESFTKHWRYQIHPPRSGDQVVLGMRHEGGLLLVDRCENMVFESVTVYASPCFVFYEVGHGEGGNTYRNCRVIRRPDSSRLLTSAADCFHSINQRRGPLIENCEFSWTMDDLVNIHGYFNVVLETLSDDELLMVTPFGTSLNKRSMLTFFSAPCGEEKFHAAVISVTTLAGSEQEGLRRVKTLYRDKLNIALQNFPDGNLCRVKFDRPITAESGDFSSSYDSCGSGAVLRNNYFHDCHVRGILLKAADCRIENNRIERTALNGIILKPEFFWLEGPMPRNIVISGNVLTGCSFNYMALAAILVMCGCCPPPHDRITSIINMEGIIITGNTISQCNAGSGIAVFNCRNPRVTNNRIEHPFSNPTAINQIDLSSRLELSERAFSSGPVCLKDSRSAIIFLGSDGIECRDNTLIDLQQHCNGMAYIG